jgi:allophanate hydrolase
MELTGQRADAPARAAAALRSAAQARGLPQPAFITVLTDEQIIGYAARASPDAPLAGTPFAIKDNIDVAGVPTTAANPSRQALATTSATAVGLLIAAGAIPIGKTNLDQYATGLVGTRSPYGACHSVFSAEHVSGGSSSGSAVAVASGVVPFALATDTAGSGRVPAAFNGLVGFKATKGRVSTAGVLPACRSLDCLTVLARTVSMVRSVFEVIARFDTTDAYSRRVGGQPPTRRPIWTEPPTIGLPHLDLELDRVHERAWQATLARVRREYPVRSVDVRPFLQAAELLYSGPWVAERAAAFGRELSDGPESDPSVRTIVRSAAAISAEDTFRGIYRLAELARQSEAAWTQIDALLLPVTPTHPSLAEVADEPFAVNSRLGRFTNMTNLLDLAAIAVPAGMRADGLPFGVQFLAPAFSDELLLDLGARWTGELRATGTSRPPPGAIDLAVAGAHLRGQPLNGELVGRGARLIETTRTAANYRMYAVPGPLPRPGLTPLPSNPTDHAGPLPDAGPGVEVEVWRLPEAALGGFAATVLPPLALGPLTLADGRQVLGFLCTADAVDPARDITGFGGWRSYLARPGPLAPS